MTKKQCDAKGPANKTCVLEPDHTGMHCSARINGVTKMWSQDWAKNDNRPSWGL